MTLVSRVWHAVVDLTVWLTATNYSFSPAQRILGTPVSHVPHASYDHPHFRPPAGDPEDHTFVCDYPQMEGWSDCSTPDNRGCWLRHENGTEYNISTNYEVKFPTGITRSYTLNVTDMTIHADGIPFKEGKVFNATYPGPWIEACWGDTINITVINNMDNEGTSIHWHGIRQLGSMAADGVNGITQCPIAPGSNFTYSFKAMQYGTSWYHSHYSVQYADGLQGPLTIHGPHSAPWDASRKPLLMTDWSHVSAHKLLLGQDRNESFPTILLNGTGDVEHYGYEKQEEVPGVFNLTFSKTPLSDSSNGGKRYLLRLINTSFDTTFVFTIDNHWLEVISTDFVPITPYRTHYILIGIGQRYNVIVEASPDMGKDERGNKKPAPENFWIRTFVADKCGTAPTNPELGDRYANTGILTYNINNEDTPQTERWPDISKKCEDEPYNLLRPVLPWKVGPPANGRALGGEQFNIGFEGDPNKDPGFKERYSDFPVAKFSLQRSGNRLFSPLQIDWDDPTIEHLNDPVSTLPQKWIVVPENFTEEHWVYLVLAMDDSLVRAAHPIHLHGHDFVILQQAENTDFSPDKLNLTLTNPPRRDVVHLPKEGFVVIAFKSDNPGAWLMHCHIAVHASMGLALQILERQNDAAKIYHEGSPAKAEADRVCAGWKEWKAKHHPFEGDSGI